MADMNLRQNLSQNVTQRTVLLGRVKMAQAIEMKEPDWAKMLAEVEKDPLFQDLLKAETSGKKIVSYQRFKRTSLAGQFYDMQDVNVAGSSGESPETLLGRKKHLLELIQKIGQENFEKYYLYREAGLSDEQIIEECHVSPEQHQEIRDFVLEMSVNAEFYHPSVLNQNTSVQPNLVGKIIANDDGTFSMSFFSPHLARGRYEINHDAFKNWKKEKKIGRPDATKLRKFLGLLELSNLKQGAFMRVIEYMLDAQKDYLRTQDFTQMAPISLRQVSRILHFAPSTISRVIGTKSVLLPWDHEVTLLHLMPGKRKVVLKILERMIAKESKHQTDAYYSSQLVSEFGIKVSRRTVTACRHALGLREPQVDETKE